LEGAVAGYVEVFGALAEGSAVDSPGAGGAVDGEVDAQRSVVAVEGDGGFGGEGEHLVVFETVRGIGESGLCLEDFLVVCEGGHAW